MKKGFNGMLTGMIEELSRDIKNICERLFDETIDPELNFPEEQFGDFTTNVSMRLAGKLGKKPAWIAEEIVQKLSDNDKLDQVNIAGPGFINMRLKNSFLVELLDAPLQKKLANQEVVIEFSDPNPFKVLHAGHLYTSIIGESIARLIAKSGAVVHRVNYGGDVGLHVAKTMWAILHKLNGENPDLLSQVDQDHRSQWLSERYIEGNSSYDNNEAAGVEIKQLNKKIYQIHIDKDKSSNLAQIYWTTRQWSYDYFDEFYEKIGIKYEKYYPESQVFSIGKAKVEENIGKVYEESDGAVVFKGEDQGLHTRVFITKEGIPTYEAKEVGLAFTKKADYDFDLSVIVTANEIMQYMQVVQKSIEKFAPELVQDTLHINHGLVKLPGGVKMSSRAGNILEAAELMKLAKKANKDQNNSDDELISLGAIKYAFLKNRIGGDVIYNPDESVSLEGNSGPYIQYALARAKSILAKSKNENLAKIGTDLDHNERRLARKISLFNSTYDVALKELAPHYICTFLFELCQEFNRFYEKNRVIDDVREPIRLKLVEYYCEVLKTGLDILGINVPESM